MKGAGLRANPVQQQTHAVFLVAKYVFATAGLGTIEASVKPVAVYANVWSLACIVSNEFNGIMVEEPFGACVWVMAVKPITLNAQANNVMPVVATHLHAHESDSLCLDTADNLTVMTHMHLIAVEITGFNGK